MRHSMITKFGGLALLTSLLFFVSPKPIENHNFVVKENLEERMISQRHKLFISEQIGTINEEYINPNSERMIYLIPEIHASSKITRNIDEIIEQIFNYHKPEKKLIGVEGSSGEFKEEHMRIYNLLESIKESGKKADDIIEEEIEAGRINGPALYALDCSPEELIILGVENEDVYNVEMYYYVSNLEYQDQIKEVMSKAEKNIDLGKKKFYPKELRLYDKLKTHEKVNYLIKKSKSFGYDWKSNMPNLEKVILEKKFDFFKLNNEYKDLESIIKYYMIKDERGHLVYRCDDGINLLKKYLTGKIDSKDLERLQSEKGTIYNDFKQLCNLLCVNDPLSKHLPIINKVGDNFSDFYYIVKKRDGIMARNLLDKMNEEEIKLAVMTTGGMHTSSISQILKDEEISYCVVVPRSDKVDFKKTQENYISEIQNLYYANEKEIEKSVRKYQEYRNNGKKEEFFN